MKNIPVKKVYVYKHYYAFEVMLKTVTNVKDVNCITVT